MEEKLSRREKIKRGILKMPKGARARKPPPAVPTPQPTALENNEALLNKAAAFCEAGNFPKKAWLLAGGSGETWKRYVRRAKLFEAFKTPQDEPYYKIVARLDLAHASHENRLVQLITKLAYEKKDLNALVKILQGAHEDWVPKQRIEVINSERVQLMIAMVEEVAGVDAAELVARRFVSVLGGDAGVPAQGGAAEGR